ncbi:MAG: Ig-like domain-containing protein, partial [Muribaculaceae bacterium]|nr:Ig-like domain-containing protein [Muribaculaceae bacterium]
MKTADWMRLSLMGGLALLTAACASIGRPEGGPRDVTPPVYVRSNPGMGATGVERPRVDIFFNENIQLEDISNKLVISPAQKQNPSISSNGKRVSVELRDSLLPNTTYT